MKHFLIIIAVQFFSLTAFSAALSSLGSLPSNDLLRTVSEKLNNEWTEKNKSNCGITKVRSFQIKASATELSQISKKLLIESYGSGIDPKTEIKIDSRSIEEADMAVVINALMESNDYDPGSFDPKIAFTKNLQQLLNKLEVNKNTLVITSEAILSNCHPGQKVKSFFFYKAESEKAFQVFTAQGYL